MLKKYKLSILWAVIIFALCIVKPSGNMAKALVIPHLDKIAHFGIHAILACFMLYEYHKVTGQKLLQIGLKKLLLIGISYGIVIELLQKWTTTYRNFDLMDIFANITGTICGALIMIIYLKKIKYARL